MDYICKGIYRELLDECWVKGYVLSNLEDLADIVGCEEEVIEKYWHMLSKCLILLENGKRLHNLASDKYGEDGNHKLVSSSLNEERTIKDTERVKRSLSGSKGGKSKNSNANKINELPLLTEASASKCLAKEEVCHIEEKRREEKSKEEITLLVNPTDSPTNSKKAMKDSVKKGFEQWWVLYDKKVRKKDALKVWLKLSIEDMKKAVGVADEYAKSAEKKFRKNPDSYLRCEGFNDEIIKDSIGGQKKERVVNWGIG